MKLILTVLVLDAQSLDTFSLPKSVAAHATSLVLAALVVWLIARYGRRLLFWSSVHVAVGGLLVTFALASVFALDPTVALFGTFRRYLGLTQMLDNALLYLAAGILVRDARSFRLLGIVTLGTAVPVLLYALVQKFGLDPLKFREGGSVPISFLGNPDLAGSYLAITGTTAFGVAFLLFSRLSRTLVAGLVLLGVACIGTLFLTGVRAGVLALVAGLIATVLLAAIVPWRETWWRRGLLAFAAVLVLAVIVSPIGGRLRPDRLANDPAIVSRLEIWDTAERAVARRPLLGIGPDNFTVFYPANRNESSASTGLLENSTHSFPLYVATSAGLLGLLAFAALIALTIERGLNAGRRGDLRALALVPLFAYLGQSLVGVNEVVLDWLFWLSCGLLAAAGAAPLRRPRTGWRRPVRATLLGWTGVLVAAGVIVLVQLPRLAAGEAMLLSDGYTVANRAAEGVPYGQHAVAADPRRGETWSSYGTSLASNGNLAAAVAAYTTSTQREPWLPLGWKNLAIVWAQLGNRSAALASVERAIRADPYDGEAHDLLSSLAFDAGDYTRAAAEGELAIAYRTPPQESTYYGTASAYIALKDLARAEITTRAGAKLYPNALLRLQLAAILADEGKKSEALAVVDALLTEQPNLPDAVRLKQAIQAKP